MHRVVGVASFGMKASAINRFKKKNYIGIQVQLQLNAACVYNLFMTSWGLEVSEPS